MTRPRKFKRIIAELLDDYDGLPKGICRDIGMSSHRFNRIFLRPETACTAEEDALRALHHQRHPDPIEQEERTNPPCPPTSPAPSPADAQSKPSQTEE